METFASSDSQDATVVIWGHLPSSLPGAGCYDRRGEYRFKAPPAPTSCFGLPVNFCPPMNDHL